MSGEWLIVHVSVFHLDNWDDDMEHVKKSKMKIPRNLAIYLPDTGIMWDLLVFSEDYIYSFRY